MSQKIQNSKFKTHNWALTILLLLYLFVALAHASLAPLTTGPDELAHYEYVRFITEHGRLPLNTAERDQASYKSDQPPLYHLLAAIPASLVDPAGPPYLKRVSDHPRRQLIERTRHAWGLYNTEDELWPYRAEVLRWHTGRWLAILFGAATVAVTFFMAREVFNMTAAGRPPTTVSRPAQPYIHHSPFTVHNSQFILPLAAAAIVAFTPRFALTGSMLNYETTLAFFSALFLWVLLRTAWASVANERTRRANVANGQLMANPPSAPRSPLLAPRLTLYVVLLGLFAGLAILTKLSALILPLEVAVGLGFMAIFARGIPSAGRWKFWRRSTGLSWLTTLAVISLWFGFVVYQFNTVARDGPWAGLLRPLIAADSSDATTNRLLSFLTGGQAGFTAAIENLDSGPLWEWLAIFFRTFWVVGIEGYQPLGLGGLLAALALCLAAAYGLILAWRSDRRPIRQVQGRPPAHSPGSEQTADRGKIEDTLPPPRLILSLLLLHLAAAFILPLLRYAATFSLADTAQGRHVMFQAAAAFAILLNWGLSEAVAGHKSQVASRKSQVASRKSQVAGQSQPVTRNTSDYLRFRLHASRFTLHALRFTLSTSRFAPLLPGLFLLIWSSVQLWYMSWAYLPLLPVRTVPQAKAQAAHQLNQPFNNYVTLAGYTHQLEANGLLQIDLLWQATAVSPVDFLTEASLVDSAGNRRAQWLGYSANGRYPTRAWDVGDLVRDTAWLPVGHLPGGDYRLQLDLKPTAQTLPGQPLPTLPAPLIVGSIALPPALPAHASVSASVLDSAKASLYTLWQNGRPLTTRQPFRERETILVTVNPALSNPPQNIQLTQAEASSASGPAFAPVVQAEYQAIFMVGPDWPAGFYALRGVSPNGQFYQGERFVQVSDLWSRLFSLPDPPPYQEGLGGVVEANFANQVKLLGYNLGANRAEPGGGIPITLYWQGLDWMGYDYTIFTRLLAADQTSHGGRDRLPREGYRTLYWAPGEIVVDPFGVPVDADAPAGIYYLNVGLYKEVNGQAVSLPLVRDDQPIEATSVTIGPLKIGSTPPGWTVPTANPQVSLAQSFGDGPHLTLLGYDLTDETGRPISNLKLTLYWQVESPLPLDYTTFIHLRNEAGEIVAQKDQPPLGGVYPTSLWEPGEIIADEISVSLPENLPPGQYSLVVGLYDLSTGARLPVPGQPDQVVTLTTLELTR